MLMRRNRRKAENKKDVLHRPQMYFHVSFGSLQQQRDAPFEHTSRIRPSSSEMRLFVLLAPIETTLSAISLPTFSLTIHL